MAADEVIIYDFVKGQGWVPKRKLLGFRPQFKNIWDRQPQQTMTMLEFVQRIADNGRDLRYRCRDRSIVGVAYEPHDMYSRLDALRTLYNTAARYGF